MERRVASFDPFRLCTTVDTLPCAVYHNTQMQIVQSDTFTAWLDNVKDERAAARIVTRIRRMEIGNAGDVRSVGDGVSEIRIDYGPGYRVYFARRGRTLVILLCGGDKKSQRKDIALAKRMAKEA
jgi:putative addiction module killer protein